VQLKGPLLFPGRKEVELRVLLYNSFYEVHNNLNPNTDKGVLGKGNYKPYTSWT